jgi:hypothetical protein
MEYFSPVDLSLTEIAISHSLKHVDSKKNNWLIWVILIAILGLFFLYYIFEDKNHLANKKLSIIN